MAQSIAARMICGWSIPVSVAISTDTMAATKLHAAGRIYRHRKIYLFCFIYYYYF